VAREEMSRVSRKRKAKSYKNDPKKSPNKKGLFLEFKFKKSILNKKKRWI